MDVFWYLISKRLQKYYIFFEYKNKILFLIFWLVKNNTYLRPKSAGISPHALVSHL